MIIIQSQVPLEVGKVRERHATYRMHHNWNVYNQPFYVHREATIEEWQAENPGKKHMWPYFYWVSFD